jgi:hypothetical protein
MSHYDDNASYGYGYSDDDQRSYVSYGSSSGGSSFLNPQKKKQRQLAEKAKMEDKGYRKMYVDGKKFEMYFTTNMPGTAIRNAVTGVRFPQFPVGSKCEYLFFKVAMATGLHGRDGAMLFYDTPEQYERHMKIEVLQSEKQHWHARSQAIEKILNK